ncbi:MAG: ankyrin repeat domain-containing protein, partial [Synergistaceae bacterium]|nr:ankyrin repeat domain-containing protein [Synergistaceae bacterium]
WKYPESWTVLMIAARYNENPEVTSALINAGADVNAKDPLGLTALMIAAQYNENSEVTSALINAGTDVNEKGLYFWTAPMVLMLAEDNNNSEATNALIKAKMDFYAERDGWTALMMAAAQNKNPEIISILLKNGADAQAKDKDGKSAIDYARKNDKLKNTDAVRELEEAVK